MRSRPTRGRWRHAERHKKSVYPSMLPFAQQPRRLPVEPAIPHKFHKDSVLPRLAPMALMTQPPQIARHERPQQCLATQPPRHLNSKPMIQLIRAIPAYLAKRMLYLVRRLPRSHPIVVEAITMPSRLRACSPLITPAADPIHRRLTPFRRAVHKTARMSCRMTAVMK